MPCAESLHTGGGRRRRRERHTGEKEGAKGTQREGGGNEREEGENAAETSHGRGVETIPS